MDKHARQAMIDELQQRNARDLADLAARRQQREMRGEVLDDLVRANYAPVRKDMRHQKRPEPQPHNDTPLDALADEVGIVTGRIERELVQLREEVGALRADLTILTKAQRYANA